MSYWTKRRKIHSKVQTIISNSQNTTAGSRLTTTGSARDRVYVHKSVLSVNGAINTAVTASGSGVNGLGTGSSTHASVFQGIRLTNSVNTRPDDAESHIFPTQDHHSVADITSDGDPFETGLHVGIASDLSPSDDENDSSLPILLAQWAVQNKITHLAIGSLLDILSKFHPELPKDARTLMSTGRVEGIKLIGGGSYYHFGLVNGILQQLKIDLKLQNKENILVQVSTDGLPLFKSSTGQFWPILGLLEEASERRPFVIGLFYGNTKPKDPEEFLSDFIDEMSALQLNGLQHNDRHYQVELRTVVCDAPARAFVKRVKSHSGYSACEKCTQRGVYQGKMTFPQTNAPLRTDEGFDKMDDEDHHTGPNPFARLSIGMISAFPLDYMHLVCLGVVRRVLLLWMKGPLPTRLGTQSKATISNNLLALKNHMPKEFARKPRSLSEVERWKATEFRSFLLYTGPVVLKESLPKEVYDNFLLLSTAVRILADANLCHNLCDYASGLRVHFVEHFGQLYGKDQLVYNIHNLVHLAADVKLKGPLDAFSAFPFENFLHSLKRLIRKPTHPLQQAVLRLREKMNQEEVLPVSDRTNSNLRFRKEHFRGPLPTEYSTCRQFGEVEYNTCHLTADTGNNCVKIGSDICLVRNIVQCEATAIVVYQKYTTSEPLFRYPMDSSSLGIHVVGNLSERVHIAEVNAITGKYVLLPIGQKEAAMRLIHKN